MASVFTLSPVHPIAPFQRHVGSVPFSLLLGATYATATGGVPVTAAEVEALLDDYGPENSIRNEDVVFMIGATTLGHTAIFNKQADGSWLIKLWNGTTEIADGALTNTIKGIMFFSAGAQQ